MTGGAIEARRLGATVLVRTHVIVRAGLVGAALIFIAAYVAIALARLRYPFELEWMEGVMVDHVRRVLAGQPIYAKPSLDFVSLLYPPLYYLAGAAFSTVFGIGFLPLRLLSFLSSLGVFALMFALVRRETGSRVSGVVAAGLFAATYYKVGGWFDLARLDSFYLLLLLAVVFTLRRASSAAAAAWAGLLMAAAFLTKQSALVIFVPLTAGALVADFRRGCSFAGTAALLMGASAIVLDRSTGGWFSYYCFTLPAHHPSVARPWIAFWRWDLLAGLRVACLAASVAVLLRCLGPRRDRWRFYYPLLAAGMIGSSWSVRTMVGAEVNNLLPAYAAIAILAALGLHDVAEIASRANRRAAAWALLLAEVLFIVQFAGLRYDPRAELPRRADLEAGRSVVAALSTVPGEVFAPHHGYLALLAGKRSFAHTLAMDNVFLDDTGPARRDLEQQMLDAIRGGRFGAVLVESDGWRAAVIRSRYPSCTPLFDRRDVFWPVTGGRLRPEFLCRR
jgi:4-amino-4-deoxy-L-arabinose transferase-like glycosyltransferase